MQTIDHTTKQNGNFKFRVVVERNNGSVVEYLESTRKGMLETAWAMQCAHKSVCVFDKNGSTVL